jgi:hypothetical protein
MHVKITNEEIAIYSIHELMADNPDTSFPDIPTAELLASFDVYACSQALMPTHDRSTQKCDPGDFVIDGDGYIREWKVTNKPLDEVTNIIRNNRDYLISETDWMTLNDSPTISQEWIDYRQELRDLTSQDGFPYDVVWPIKPE